MNKGTQKHVPTTCSSHTKNAISGAVSRINRTLGREAVTISGIINDLTGRHLDDYVRNFLEREAELVKSRAEAIGAAARGQ